MAVSLNADPAISMSILEALAKRVRNIDAVS